MKRTPYYSRAGITLYCGDSLEVAPELDAESVSAVVTDPPYGLGFMGKAWDRNVPGVPFWHAFMHAMKPGAHLLAFGGSRTYHRMGVAIEDAGLELRDTLMWLYGSGFPKSHDVSKAIESNLTTGKSNSRSLRATEQAGDGEMYTLRGKNNGIMGETRDFDRKRFTPATPEAARWAGWGTALKPAHEPVILARKPLSGTVAANVLAHGTGALNIDACRIPGGMDDTPESWAKKGAGGKPGANGYAGQFSQGMKDAYARGDIPLPTGRWPANVILDEDAAAALDRQSGERPSRPGKTKKSGRGVTFVGGWKPEDDGVSYPGDTGGASRFFYVAKASRKERNAGLEGMPERRGPVMSDRCVNCGKGRMDGRRTGPCCNRPEYEPTPARGNVANHHPTVKPLALMRYLITLITPPGGIVLDPFAGSGSTLVACAELGFPAIGIELSEEYCEIIARRVDHALNERPAVVQPSLLEMVAD